MDVEPRAALEELCGALLVYWLEHTRLPRPISQYVSSNFLLVLMFFSSGFLLCFFPNWKIQGFFIFLFYFKSKGVVCCLPFWVWLVCYNWVAFAFWVVGGTWLLSILSVTELFWLNQCNLSFLIWLILGGKCIWAPFSLFYEIRNLQLPLLTLVVLWLRWRACPELQSLSSKFNVNLPK